MKKKVVPKVTHIQLAGNLVPGLGDVARHRTALYDVARLHPITSMDFLQIQPH